MLTANAAEELWKELSQRYNLEWAPIQVGQVKLEILQIRDLEDYLVSNIEAQGLSLENFPLLGHGLGCGFGFSRFLGQTGT